MTIAVLEALTFGLGRLVAAADQEGQRLCLLTGDREVYRHELDHLRPGALDIIDVNTHDLDQCAAVLHDLPDLRGLISSTDTWMRQGAELAARFGLPGPDLTTVGRLRDKLAVRVLLRESGLSRGTAVPAFPGAGATAVLSEIGLPAVLKDSAGTGSRNVWLVRDAHELRVAVTQAADRRLLGHLFAEPFLPGPLFSAETLTWAGRTRLLGVTGRLLSPQWFGREELLSFPALLPDADLDAVDGWVTRVLAVAGHTRGFAHVEFVLTTAGPELVEINARIGGCLAGEAMCRSLDTNVYRAMIEMALGRAPGLLDADLDGAAARARATATVLIYPGRTGVLTAMTGVEQLDSYPGAPSWYPTMAIGTPIEVLGDQRACAGLLLAEGATTELALYNALSAARVVRPIVAER